MAAGIFFGGLSFFAAGKVETFLIDKATGVMSLTKTACCCCNSSKAFDLKEVSNIRAFKKGHEGINFYTLHYAINVEFNTDEAPVKIWDSPNKKTIDDKMIEIRSFLGMENKQGQLKMIDVSTRI